MRSDMAKVVTEAPRRGHGSPSAKTARRLNRDEIEAEVGDEADGVAPLHVTRRATAATVKRVKASRHGQYGWNAKEFSDVLGPLRKYLRKQVGRPWDKVYSELSQTLDKRSLTGLHIWDHIKSEVNTHTRLAPDGKTVYPKATRFSYADDYPVDGLYVHPTTGLLRYAPRRRYTGRPPAPVVVVKLDNLNELRRIDGIWYDCEYRTVTEHVPASWRSFVYRERETHHRYYIEGKDKTAEVLVVKRQLSRAELKRHGLKNAVAV
jgi:hypothetical protein